MSRGKGQGAEGGGEVKKGGAEERVLKKKKVDCRAEAQSRRDRYVFDIQYIWKVITHVPLSRVTF